MLFATNHIAPQNSTWNSIIFTAQSNFTAQVAILLFGYSLTPGGFEFHVAVYDLTSTMQPGLYPADPAATFLGRNHLRLGNADITATEISKWNAHAIAVQSSTNNTPAAFTPRWLGDELLIHGVTNIIYRAFGSSTNDWRQTYP